MSKFVNLFELFSENAVLENAKIDKVQIPQIQRPYAQGRPTEELVRNDFLTFLFDTLINGTKADLNIIYGKQPKESNNFELLDGQQRFTTLYLLVWYLVVREKKYENEEVPKLLRSFSYNTRPSTSRFCDFLSDLALADKESIFEKMRRPLDVEGKDFSDCPQLILRNELKFVSAYSKDPSVSSMLTMLDAIHKKYQDYCPSCSLFDNIGNIEFNVLSLGDFDMSEDLHIKMNARGLALTPFECFKADLNDYMGNYYDHKASFAERMDHKDWCDLFWKTDDPESFDTNYLRFFSRFFAATYLLDNADLKSDKGVRRDSYIKSFYTLYDDTNYIKKNNGQNKYYGFKDFESRLNTPNTNYLNELFNVLTLLSKEKKLNDYLFISKEISQPGLVIFAAVILYLRKYDVTNIFNNNCSNIPSPEVFNEWIKIINNISYADYVQTWEVVVGVIKNIVKLSVALDNKPDSSQAFYKALSDIAEDSTFNNLIRSEIFKAKKLAGYDGEKWKTAFEIVDKNPLFKEKSFFGSYGIITFYYDEKITVEEFQKLVRILWNDSNGIFSANGISDLYRKDHILLRALLSCCSFSDIKNLTFCEDSKFLRNFLINIGTKTADIQEPDMDESNDIEAVSEDELEHEVPVELTSSVLTNLRILFANTIAKADVDPISVVRCLTGFVERNIENIKRTETLNWAQKEFMINLLSISTLFDWPDKSGKPLRMSINDGYYCLTSDKKKKRPYLDICSLERKLREDLDLKCCESDKEIAANYRDSQLGCFFAQVYTTGHYPVELTSKDNEYPKICFGSTTNDSKRYYIIAKSKDDEAKTEPIALRDDLKLTLDQIVNDVKENWYKRLEE